MGSILRRCGISWRSRSARLTARTTLRYMIASRSVSVLEVRRYGSRRQSRRSFITGSMLSSVEDPQTSQRHSDSCEDNHRTAPIDKGAQIATENGESRFFSPDSVSLAQPPPSPAGLQTAFEVALERNWKRAIRRPEAELQLAVVSAETLPERSPPPPIPSRSPSRSNQYVRPDFEFDNNVFPSKLTFSGTPFPLFSTGKLRRQQKAKVAPIEQDTDGRMQNLSEAGSSRVVKQIANTLLSRSPRIAASIKQVDRNGDRIYNTKDRRLRKKPAHPSLRTRDILPPPSPLIPSYILSKPLPPLPPRLAITPPPSPMPVIAFLEPPQLPPLIIDSSISWPELLPSPPELLPILASTSHSSLPLTYASSAPFTSAESYTSFPPFRPRRHHSPPFWRPLSDAAVSFVSSLSSLVSSSSSSSCSSEDELDFEDARWDEEDGEIGITRVLELPALDFGTSFAAQFGEVLLI